MRPVAPRIEGCDEVTLAENQLEYLPITAALVPSPGWGGMARVCRWTFTAEERKKIAAGEDIYFWTIASIPLMPHALEVGVR